MIVINFLELATGSRQPDLKSNAGLWHFSGKALGSVRKSCASAATGSQPHQAPDTGVSGVVALTSCARCETVGTHHEQIIVLRSASVCSHLQAQQPASMQLVALLGSVLLLLDICVPSTARERSIVAHIRLNTGSQIVSRQAAAIVRLLAATGFEESIAKVPAGQPMSITIPISPLLTSLASVVVLSLMGQPHPYHKRQPQGTVTPHGNCYLWWSSIHEMFACMKAAHVYCLHSQTFPPMCI